MPLSLPRLYAILDTGSLAKRQIPVFAAAEALIEAGVRLLQFRHKGSFSRAAFEEARQVKQICDAAKAIFIMNDRADAAMLLDAGLHLGQDDLPPMDARGLLGPDAALGHSTHNREQLIAADALPVDYLAIGPVFTTGSKQNPDPVVGLDALAQLRTLTRKPLVAIGGITLRNAPSVFATGIDAVAVIGGLLPEAGSAVGMRDLGEEWLRTIRDMV